MQRHFAMYACFYLLVVSLAFTQALATAAEPARHSRGLIAIAKADQGTFVSWRLLASDPAEVAFDLFRINKQGDRQQVNQQPLTGATSLLDPQSNGVRYELQRTDQPNKVSSTNVWGKGFLEIPIQPIPGYRPGDASIGDLDGDGEWEIVLHQMGRSRDNGFAGVTSEPILDAYKLDGQLLWRINLGKNIREGEHYTQFMVYDLDGDGCAEVACKTADGTTDGQGQVLGDRHADWRTFRDGAMQHGRILDGPEYLTVFDGRTGKALATTNFVPGRGKVDGWGGIGGNNGNDNYGNRCDRFLACVAYLDGEHPSLVMSRGVYGRIAMTAWDWRNGKLSQRWKFDTGVSWPPYKDASPYAGMGGHNLSVGDVDEDGRDEIVFQAMVIDDDGQGAYSTGLRHGDAMYLTDIDPTRSGQEVFTIQENEDDAELFQTPAAAYRDAKSGEILWSHSPAIDAPAGMAADIDPRHYGLEMWGGPGGLRNVTGDLIGKAPRIKDWCLWWDGDPLRELLSLGRPASRWRRSRRDSPTRVMKWDWQAAQEKSIFECNGQAASRGPALVGDLLGDWREELLLVAPDRKSLRLYSTTIPTELRHRTLLADRQYRLSLAWQNVVYNKPPQLSYFLGASAPRSGQAKVAKAAVIKE